MGLASTYQNVVQNIGHILILSVVPEIAAFVDVGYIFYAISALFIFITIFLVFSIRDVTKEKVEAPQSGEAPAG